MSRRPASMHLLALHRTALATLARRLAEDRTGGVLAAVLETLRAGLGARGALAYRLEGEELVLVAEEGLPPAARAELSHLPLAGGFVAQHAAREVRSILDDGAAIDQNDVLRMALTLAGWHHIAAVPMAVGRAIRGVLVVGVDAPHRLGRDGMMFVDAVAAMAMLALDRQAAGQREREERIAGEHAARMATMGMVSTATVLDMAVPLSAMLVQLEAQQRALETLRAHLVHLVGESAIDELESLDEAEVLGEDMASGLRRVQGVASHLLELSRRSRPAPVDLTHVLDNVLALMRGKLDATGIALVLEGDNQPLYVDGRAESLQALLVQVVLYAVEMCEEAGVRSPTIHVRLSSDGLRNVIRVESSATSATQRRAFDAFVRKHTSARAGVGLSLAAQTAVAHDGHIEVGSSEEGTGISVVLPASRVPVRARPTRSSRPPPPEAMRPAVLLVGQDERLVGGLRDELRRHRIVAAGSLAEASKMLAELGEIPEMVLCDVSLPDGTGMELHQRSAQELQKTFVFTTGGVLTSEAASYLRSSIRPTLLRPISPEEVKLLLSDDEAPSGAPTLSGRRKRRDTEPIVSIPPISAQRERRSVRSARRRRAVTGSESPVAKTRTKPPNGTDP